MTMQPNNKCTCPSGDGSLRWPCPVHPAASAHEAVGEVYQGSARRPQAKLNAELPVGTKLYAAPVTAAPAAEFPLTLRGLIAYGQTAANPSQGAVPSHMRDLIGQMVPHLKRLDEIESRTPAAPGIDLSEVPRYTLAHGDFTSEMLEHSQGAWVRLGDVESALLDASPKGGSDPWRGLYASERTPNRDEYGCFYHPDIPSWDDEREESIAPLLKAQGFDLQCVPGDFSDEAMEEGGERYWQEMREWNPEPEGDGWRLVAIYDTEDGPYSMFVKPLAQTGDAEVQP